MAETGNFFRLSDLISRVNHNLGVEIMMNDKSSEVQARRNGGMPLVVAIAIAVVGVLGILIYDHGPRSRPTVTSSVIANYSTTGEAARAAGAQVLPTEPGLQVEPDPAGPKPVNPASPAPPQ